MKKSLIVWGGWDGHDPKRNADIFLQMQEASGFAVRVESSLDILADADLMKTFDLITPIQTMGAITGDQLKGLHVAVAEGAGLAGTHGGMGDAFRGVLAFEWMVGGHFVAHPHVGDYEVVLTDVDSPITRDVEKRFAYNSEQYYMMVDPGVTVLATTPYQYRGRCIDMPVVWTKRWYEGNVFYSSLGHAMSEYTDYPQMAEMVKRGFVWAARG